MTDPAPGWDTAAEALELEIARGRLQSIVDEAGAVIMRTAFSQIVREAKDFACALLTPDGRTIVQSTGVPVFMGTATYTAQRLLELIPEAQWEPGAVMGTNDVWLGTGHLYDLTLVMPVFVEGSIVALTSVVVHLPDVGGRGWGREARQVFEEGFQIPAMQIGTAEGFDPMLLRLLLANVRLPDQVAGDMDAALNATVTMGDQVAAVCEEMSPCGFERVWSGLEARTEAYMRSKIAELPDGTYGSSFDSDQVDGISFHLQVEIRIDGEEITADFAGSSPQVPVGINCCLAYARAYLIFGLKCLLAPTLPLNEGVIRVLHMVAPDGSVVNSKFPAAGTARNLVGMHIPALVFRALAEVIPATVAAESGSPHPILSITGTDPRTGQLFAASLEVPGGFGARASMDGPSVVQFPANTRLMAIEMMEATAPLLFMCRELLPDSGGAGQFRGGLGQRISVSSLADSTFVALHVDRLHTPPLGLFGGRSGSGVRLRVGQEEITDTAGSIEMGPRNILTVESPGGGGYGDPAKREPAALERDLQVGYVSEKAAHEVYRKEEVERGQR